MSRENLEKESLENKLAKVIKFSELFDFINAQRLNKEYQNCYEDAARVAKNLIDTKSKSSWDARQFEKDVKNKYPDISEEFISALKLCIENYNPPVNLPSKPLWE